MTIRLRGAEPAMDGTLTCRYAVDGRDRIVSVSPEWLAFAAENDAAGLTEQAVVGRPIWSFIADEETRHLYDLLFRQVRERGRPVTVPFRCDSPSLRRFMELSIGLMSDQRIDLSARLLRVEPQPREPLLDATATRSDALMRICGWCKRIHDEVEGWCEIADVVRRRGLFQTAPVPRLTHGICPDCGRQIELAMERSA